MNHLFVIHGDITRLAADAVVYSTTRNIRGTGKLFASFERAFDGFAEACDRARERSKELPVGGAFVIGRAATPDGGPRARQTPLVVGVVALTSESRAARIVDGRVVIASSAEDEIRAAVAGSIRCAVDTLRAAGRTGRLLIALPMFLQGEGGGGSRPHELAQAQVEAAQAELERHGELDLALVAYTEDLYRALLEARRKVARPSGQAVSEALVAAFRAREGVLFVGSGVSLPAGLPSWGELTNLLRDHLGLPRNEREGIDDYLDLAQWHRENVPEDSDHGLGNVIRDLYGEERRPTLAHYLLLGLGARTLITTNYDRLIEQALIGLRHRPVTIVRSKDVPRAIDEEQRAVVKLHGDALDPRSIVLSRDDYDHFEAERPAMALLLQGLLLTRTFLFVGYSLRDSDFRQIHARIARMLGEAQRPAHATTFDGPKPQAVAQWRRKNVELVALDPSPDYESAMARWLDALVDAVRAEPILFAPESARPETPALASLRERLRQAGEALERASVAIADETEAHLLAEVLAALAGLGWKPERPLWDLWLAIAAKAGRAERERLLRHALAATESEGDAERIEALLTARAPVRPRGTS